MAKYLIIPIVGGASYIARNLPLNRVDIRVMQLCSYAVEIYAVIALRRDAVYYQPERFTGFRKSTNRIAYPKIVK
ncbi:hypothetical protein [Mesorhizobium sp. STM 4661]|uniref:hypothetical protein n=1 Tax=Mesorhizobium sp. STM 4661 TaxID=1297570 RepID=UPI0012F841EF|nr:hypothetical protein [Mesorhizobium sp. STM 4661]